MSYFHFDSPSRVEQIILRFQISDHSLFPIARYICPETPEVGPGDTIKLEYKFMASYIGEITGKLQAILNLPEETFTTFDIQEMNHGKSLICELAILWQRIQTKCEGIVSERAKRSLQPPSLDAFFNS